jgi:hypothetical protein
MDQKKTGNYMNPHPFDKIDLLNYVTGGAPDDKAALIRAHLEVCVSCREYSNAMERERHGFLAAHPIERIIDQPARPQNIIRFPAIARYYALAASLIICIGAGYIYLNHTQTPDSRIKGETSLKVFVQADDGRVEQRANNTFFTGERVQFLYSCGPKNRFILMSLDSAGSLTTFYPDTGDSAIALESGQDIPLPNSILLDDYTGPELFIGVFSKKPVAVAEVKRLVHATYSSGAPFGSQKLTIPDAEVVVFPCTIRKRSDR